MVLHSSWHEIDILVVVGHSDLSLNGPNLVLVSLNLKNIYSSKGLLLAFARELVDLRLHVLLSPDRLVISLHVDIGWLMRLFPDNHLPTLSLKMLVKHIRS